MLQSVLDPVFIAVRREDERTTTPIADIAVFVNDIEKLPDGYQFVTTPRGAPAKLSQGTPGLQWMLCYKRCPIGSDDVALQDIEVLWPDLGDKPSEVLVHSVLNLPIP
jgi:hypothetical protein